MHQDALNAVKKEFIHNMVIAILVIKMYITTSKKMANKILKKTVQNVITLREQ